MWEAKVFAAADTAADAAETNWKHSHPRPGWLNYSVGIWRVNILLNSQTTNRMIYFYPPKYITVPSLVGCPGVRTWHLKSKRSLMKFADDIFVWNSLIISLCSNWKVNIAWWNLLMISLLWNLLIIPCVQTNSFVDWWCHIYGVMDFCQQCFR